MVGRKKLEERAMSEIRTKKRGYFESLMHETFNKIYDNGTCDDIDQFERVIKKVYSEAMNGNLEEFPLRRAHRYRSIVHDDKKPMLTLDKYAQERDAGLTNRQITQKYNLPKGPHSIGGFGRHYAARKKIRK